MLMQQADKHARRVFTRKGTHQQERFNLLPIVRHALNLRVLVMKALHTFGAIVTFNEDPTMYVGQERVIKH